MGVPCGDERDHRFAKQFGIPITNIIGSHYNGEEANPTYEAILENSDFINGMKMKDATWGSLLGVVFGSSASGGGGPVSPQGGGLSAFVEHTLRSALAVVDPAGADGAIDSLKQLLTGSTAYQIADAGWLLARVALELPTEGPYGPAWREAMDRGLLPRPRDPATVITTRFRFLKGKGAWPRVYAELDSHEMLDLLDAIRVLSPAERAELDQHLGVAGTHAARVAAALHVASTRAMPAGVSVSAPDSAALEGYVELRQWPTALPRADRHGYDWKTGAKSTHITPTGKHIGSGDPLLDVPDTGETVGNLPEPKQQALVELIRRNRLRLPERDELKSSGGGIGYEYGGVTSHERPAALPDKPNKREDEVHAAVWAEIDREGHAGAINTWDNQLFSWGQGFAAKGALPEVMRALFAGGKNAAIRNLLLDAGVIFDGANWLVVNTDTGRTEVGDDALQLLRFDRALLTLFMNIAEDRVKGEGGAGGFGQALADARYSVLLKGAGAVPQWAMGWDDRLIQFCAHCVHWGAPAWAAYSSVTKVEDAARICGAKHGMKYHLGALRIDGLAAASLLSFANNWLREVGTRGPLPGSGDHTGTMLLQDPYDKKQYWKISM